MFRKWNAGTNIPLSTCLVATSSLVSKLYDKSLLLLLLKSQKNSQLNCKWSEQKIYKNTLKLLKKSKKIKTILYVGLDN